MKTHKALIDQYSVIWKKEAHRCSRCGKCRSFCPVFIETRDEKMGTRGRISLASALASNQVDFSKEFVRSISTCLRCLRCSKECPSQVDFDKLIRGVRGLLGHRVLSYRVARSCISALLLNRFLLDAAVRAGSLGQKLLPGGKSPWIKKLPFFFRGSAVSPRFSRRSALARFAGAYPVKQPKHRVLFYVGCVINYLYPDIARAVIDVLNHFGVEVVIAKDELCCGIPAISSGDVKTAEKLARHTVAVASTCEVDYIVCACSTCANTFKKDYREMLGAEAEPFAEKVMDISLFLRKVLRADVARLCVSATYHDPCHMRFGLGITKEPRELVAQASAFIEMKNADKCCGMAGSFGILNYDLSKRIFARKAQAVRESKAQIVATGCPSCIMQLRGQLADSGISVEVVHVIELVARSIERQNARKKEKSHGKEHVGTKA
jgi:glycolate oxidase iron-sulfur subunit